MPDGSRVRTGSELPYPGGRRWKQPTKTPQPIGNHPRLGPNAGALDQVSELDNGRPKVRLKEGLAVLNTRPDEIALFRDDDDGFLAWLEAWADKAFGEPAEVTLCSSCFGR